MNPNWNYNERKEPEQDMAALAQVRVHAEPPQETDLSKVEGGPGLELVKKKFASEIVRTRIWQGQGHHEVKPGRILEILTALRDEPGLRYEMLVDVTGVDHLELKSYSYTERFGVTYILLSLDLNDRVRLKALLPEGDPRIQSLANEWPGAVNLEREVYDMYGVHFDGNPNLTRILMPDYYTGYPLRKDYPLQGRGERFNFPKITPEFRPEEAEDAAEGIYRGSPRKQRDLK